MTAITPHLIKQSDLVGQPVINRATAEELGRVEHLWLNPTTHKIVGMTCKSGLLGRTKRAFIWQQIDAIGGDSVMVIMTQPIEPECPETAIEDAIGHEVWTDAGNQAGVIKDLLINLETGEVVDYLFASSGWRGVADGVYRLSRSDVASIGSKRLIANSAAIARAEQVTVGLTQKVAQAKELLQSDYQRTKADVTSAVQSGRSLTDQAKEKLSGAAEVAQAKAQSMTDQAKNLTGQAKEKLADAAEQAQGTAQSVGDRAQVAKAQLADAAGTVQAKAQTVAEQAKESFSKVSGVVQDKAASVTGQAKDMAANVSDRVQGGNPAVGEKTDPAVQERLAEVADQVQETVEDLSESSPHQDV